MKNVDIMAAVGYIASGGAAVVITALSTAFPSQAVKIIAIGAIVTFVASLLVRLFANKTDSPATSIVQGAPVVSPGTQIVTPENTVGTITHTP